MGHSQFDDATRERAAWNAGKKVGTKRPLTQKQIWAVRFFLNRQRRVRNRALFDLAIARVLISGPATTVYAVWMAASTPGNLAVPSTMGWETDWQVSGGYSGKAALHLINDLRQGSVQAGHSGPARPSQKLPLFRLTLEATARSTMANHPVSITAMNIWAHSRRSKCFLKRRNDVVRDSPYVDLPE